MRIRFNGSGSEYFRVWVLNLLQRVVTLGLCYPWAKVRRLRQFDGKTLVYSRESEREAQTVAVEILTAA